MRVVVNRRARAQGRDAFSVTSPYDGRCGFWGKVTEVHPESNTCNVLMDMGIEVSGVRVASLEWVVVQDGKHLTGERRLPPVNSYVFCLMPTGDLASAFILCSGFLRSEALHADFKEEGEDAANTQKKVEYSGWNYEQDYRTGTRKWQNKTDEDATIALEVDQEDEGSEAISLTVHGNKLTIDKEGITLETDGELSLTVEGDVALKSNSGNVAVEAGGSAEVTANGDVTIKSANGTTSIKGTSVVVGGTVSPDATGGAFCCLPACLFTGAVHRGNTSAGAL